MSSTLPLIAGLGTPELIIILAVVVLLFGASKLPELARGSGRALRIFKAETKGLTDSDDDEPGSAAVPQSGTQSSIDIKQAELDKLQADLDAERSKKPADPAN